MKPGEEVAPSDGNPYGWGFDRYPKFRSSRTSRILSMSNPGCLKAGSLFHGSFYFIPI